MCAYGTHSVNCPLKTMHIFMRFPRLQVVSSSPSIVVQETEVHHGFPSFSKYTISAVDSQAALSASVSLSSASSEQTLIIPVTLIHVADHSAAMQGQCIPVKVSFASHLKVPMLTMSFLCEITER